MNAQQARQLALALPQASEEPHFDFTSFRIGGKIFATMPPAKNSCRCLWTRRSAHH